jgi:tRNA-Thr(GGU) m(6)t(6)A37 methyltransferase TsaA
MDISLPMSFLIKLKGSWVMTNNFVLSPIAYIYNSRTTLLDDHWGDIVSEIVLEESVPDESLDGIDKFSHAEILFYFDKVEDDKKFKYSRHPRENVSWPKVGVFAQRNKDRPNHIGLTIVRIIERGSRSLYVQGLDAVNGTPVLDMKPIMVEFLPFEPVFQPDWSHELMKEYWNNKDESIGE